MPVPLPTALVVKKGLKRRCLADSEIPTPLSLMWRAIATFPALLVVVVVIVIVLGSVFFLARVY